jgi:tetrahydromethanopterin S-methyltransferase subunit A
LYLEASAHPEEEMTQLGHIEQRVYEIVEAEPGVYGEDDLINKLRREGASMPNARAVVGDLIKRRVLDIFGDLPGFQYNGR